MNKLHYLSFIVAILCNIIFAATVEESAIHDVRLDLYLVTDHKTTDPDPKFPEQEFSGVWGAHFYVCADDAGDFFVAPRSLGNYDISDVLRFQEALYGWPVPDVIAEDLKRHFSDQPAEVLRTMYFRVFGQRILVFFEPSFLVSQYAQKKYLVPLSTNHTGVTLFGIKNPELDRGDLLTDLEASTLMLTSENLRPLGIGGDYIISEEHRHVFEDQESFRPFFSKRCIMFNENPANFSLHETFKWMQILRKRVNDRIIPNATNGSVQIVYLPGIHFSGSHDYWLPVYDRVKRCLVILIGKDHGLYRYLNQHGFIGRELTQAQIKFIKDALARC